MGLTAKIPFATIIYLSYIFIVSLTAFLSLASCIFLLSQAVRTSSNRNWRNNFNALVIGAMYISVCLVSLAFCVKRRLSMSRSLAKIPRSRVAVGKGDVSKPVKEYIDDEFVRTCAIFSTSQPKVPFRPGWGRPGSRHDGVRFRTEILKTVSELDATARLVIPSMPKLRPNASITHHLRYIRSLITADEDGEIYFYDYTNAIHKARYSRCELTEVEYEHACEALVAMKGILLEYHHMTSTDT